jgi:4-hydroxy-2-oxoheptanedioate aldolase
MENELREADMIRRSVLKGVASTGAVGATLGVAGAHAAAVPSLGAGGGIGARAMRVAAERAGEPINPLKARLDAGQPGLGMLVSMPSVNAAQVFATAGFDWLFIDMEHGPIGIEATHAMIAATAGSAAAPIVRVPWTLPWLAKPVLDAGAMGVIFPMIHTPEDAETAVRSVRYPPTGERGFAPFYASARFNLSFTTYVEPADREILCILLIETKEAVENIETIVQIPGVDVCFIAPFDLSMSYGYRDGPNHEEVQEAITQIEDAVLASDVHLGGLALAPEQANAMIDRGYRMLVTGIDFLILDAASRNILDNVNRG